MLDRQTSVHTDFHSRLAHFALNRRKITTRWTCKSCDF